MQQNINKVIFLVLGLVMGIGGTFFFGGQKATKPDIAALQSPASLKTASVLVDAHFQGEVDSLMQTNTGLIQKANATKTELQQAKHDNKILLELVDTLLAHTEQTTDTMTKLAQCDSLTETVQDLITATNIRDSLYEDLAANLQAQVRNKDSMVTVQQEQYNCMKLSFDQSLAQQQLLTGQNLCFERQLRRHKVNNKLLSAGVMLLSGFTAFTLLHH